MCLDNLCFVAGQSVLFDYHIGLDANFVKCVKVLSVLQFLMRLGKRIKTIAAWVVRFTLCGTYCVV